MGKVVIRELENGDEFPTVLDASAYDINFSDEQAASPTFTEFLQQANYEKPPVFKLDTKYEYQEASGKVLLETFRFGADDVGYLEANFELGNVDPDVLPNNALTLYGLKSPTAMILSPKSSSKQWQLKAIRMSSNLRLNCKKVWLKVRSSFFPRRTRW